jgi:hypothetical protein
VTSLVVLAVQVSFTLCTGAAAPVPVRLATAGEFEALLANDAVADADPVAPGVNFTVKFTGVPGATVTGNDSPVTENSEGFVPPSVTDDTLTLPPDAVRVPVAVPFVPTTTLPTGTVDVTVNVLCVGADAVPLNPIETFGFDAFDVTAMLPLNVPEVCGAKVTLNEVLCPAVKVSGVVIPEMLKPVPVAVACEIVRLVPPVFFRTCVWLWLCPVVTLVKVMLAGFGVNVAAATEVPLSPKVSDGFGASEVIEIEPVNVPADSGAKFTPKVVLCPDASVRGVVIPVILKPAPLAVACEIVTLEPPVFFNVSV